MPRIFEILIPKTIYWRHYPEIYQFDLDLLAAYFSQNPNHTEGLNSFLNALHGFPRCPHFKTLASLISIDRLLIEPERPAFVVRAASQQALFEILVVGDQPICSVPQHIIQFSSVNEQYWNFSQRGETGELLVSDQISETHFHQYSFVQADPLTDYLDVERTTIKNIAYPATAFETKEDRLTVLMRLLAFCLFSKPIIKCSCCQSSHDLTVVMIRRVWQLMTMEPPTNPNLVEMLAVDLMPYYSCKEIDYLFAWLTRGKLKQTKPYPGLFSSTPIRRSLATQLLASPYSLILSRFHVEYLVFNSTYRYLHQASDSTKTKWSIFRIDSVPFDLEKHEPILFREILILFCDVITCTISQTKGTAVLNQEQYFHAPDLLLDSLGPLVALINEKVFQRNNLCNILYRSDNYRALPILATFMLYEEGSFASWLQIMCKDPPQEPNKEWPTSPPYVKALAEIIYQYTGDVNTHVVNTVRILSRCAKILSLDDLLSLTYKAKELLDKVSETNDPSGRCKFLLELSMRGFCGFVTTRPDTLYDLFVTECPSDQIIQLNLISKWFENTQSPNSRLAVLRLLHKILSSQELTTDFEQDLTNIENRLLNICNEPLLLAPRRNFNLGYWASRCLILIRLKLESYSTPPLVARFRPRTAYSLAYEKSAKHLIVGLFQNHIFAQSHRPHTSALIFRVYQICDRIDFKALKNLIEPKLALMVPSVVGYERVKSDLGTDYSNFIRICIKMLTVIDHPLVEILTHLVNSFMIFPKGVQDLLFFIISYYIEFVASSVPRGENLPESNTKTPIRDVAIQIRQLLIRQPTKLELSNSTARNALFTFKKIILEAIESVYMWQRASRSAALSAKADNKVKRLIDCQSQWLMVFSLKDLVQTAHTCESEARILMLIERHLISPWVSDPENSDRFAGIDLAKHRIEFYKALQGVSSDNTIAYSSVQWNPLYPIKREFDEYTFVQLWRCLCKLRPTLSRMEKAIFSMPSDTIVIDEYSQAMELGGRVQASNVIRDWASAARKFMKEAESSTGNSNPGTQTSSLMNTPVKTTEWCSSNNVTDKETDWASLCRDITKYRSKSEEKRPTDRFVDLLSIKDDEDLHLSSPLEGLYDKLIPALRKSDQGDSIIGEILIWNSVEFADRISLTIPGQQVGGLLLQDLQFLNHLRDIGRSKASNLSTETERNRLHAMNSLANIKGWATTQVWISWHCENSGLDLPRNMVKLKTWIQNLADQNSPVFKDILEVASTFCCSRQAKMQLEDDLNSAFTLIVSPPEPLEETITSVLLQQRNDQDLTRLSISASLCPNFAPARWKLATFYTDLITTWTGDKMIMLLCPNGVTTISGEEAIIVMNKKIPYGREPESLKSIARKACIEYIQAARLDPRLSQIALLRCLSILFQFTSPSTDANAHEHFIFSQILCEAVFADFTREVVPQVMNYAASVPAPLWYRIVSHLTSRASHKYLGPALIVPILAWLWSWFPHHMNWHLQFLVNSSRPSQAKLGEEILVQALSLVSAGSRTRKSDKTKFANFPAPLSTNLLPGDVHKSIIDALRSFFKYFTEAAMDTTVSSTEPDKPMNLYPNLISALQKMEEKPINERFVLPLRSQMDNPASISIRGHPLIGQSSMARVMFDRPSANLMGPLAVPTLAVSHNDNFPMRPDIFIHTMQPTMDVLRSKQRPKKIVFIGTDGNRYPFLLKNEKKGDLRKDSRVQDFVSVANNWLADEGRVGTNQVKWTPLSSFTVILLNEIAGMIEWIPNLETLRSLTESEYHKIMPKSTIVQKQNCISESMKQYRRQPRQLLRVHFDAVAGMPPVLPRWFFATFGASASEWLRVRDRYTVSTGAWSMIGFLMGLGDRHNENLLISNLTGELVHVDFDCLFGKGFSLPVPEIVPFRMTQNLVAAFGVEGTSGLFYEACLATWSVLRHRAADCLTWMTSFVYDPLVEWRGRDGRGEGFARQTLQEMDWKLSGHNCFEAIFSDAWVAYTRQQMNRKELLKVIDEVDTKLKWSHRGLSVGDQVNQLINSSVCPLNLAVMYYGWMSWI